MSRFSWKFVPVSLVALALAGCERVETDMRPMTASELQALYTPMADVPLPKPSEAALGETLTLTGQLHNWKAQEDVPLFVTANPEPAQNGVVLPDGTLQPATPISPVANQSSSLSQLVSFKRPNTYCPLSTLTLSSDPSVSYRDTSSTFFIRASDAPKGIQSLTSFPVRWNNLQVDLSAWREAGQTQGTGLYVVNSPEEVTVKGEQRCLQGDVQTRPVALKTGWQTQTTAHFQLHKGWNILLRRSTELSKDPATGIYVSRVEWQVLPASALSHWVVGGSF